MNLSHNPTYSTYLSEFLLGMLLVKDKGEREKRKELGMFVSMAGTHKHTVRVWYIRYAGDRVS